MTENNQTRMARRNNRKKKKPTTKKGKKSVAKKIMYGVLVAMAVVALSVGGLFTYYIITAPALDPEKLEDPFSSKFYNMDGEFVGDFGEIKRTKITYDDLPEVLVDAVTATEDVRFFKHNGIDLRRIGAAIKANITGGFGSQGASTITQQVVENSFLTPEKKIKNKVQEQWLALRLERKYSKEEIMEMYLNKIFYGSGAHGVSRASEIYFGKTDLHDLTLIEAAILAGLPQRPTAYNPYESPDLMKGRVKTVLKLMVRHDKITQEEADEALDTDIESLLAGKRPEALPYEGFTQQIQKEVEAKLEDVDIYSDGLKIYTTLDNEAQEYTEFLINDSEENPIPYADDELEVGLTVLDTKTGAIRAIGGARNSENIGGFNYAVDGQYQPGSTFKPIISYGPAIEYNKWSTYHQINDDGPYDVAGSDHQIRNWNRQYQGWMSARYALEQSLNVPTVKTLVETGYGNAQDFAEGLGVKFHEDKLQLTDAIGGTETRVSPLQLAGSFRAFGNEGIYNEPYAVEKVEFPDGTVVDFQPEAKPAMSDYTAYMVTDMLKSVMTDGTGKSANIPGLPVAGKTGTTNLEGKSGSPDAWFAGYTTDYTIAIWAGGYTDEDDKRDVIPTEVSQGVPGTQIPRLLFKELMTEISKDLDTKDFERPSSVVEVDIEKGSNPAALPSAHTPSGNIVKELFVKGTEPESVSEEFDQLDPVKDLSASYDEDADEIAVSWGYDDDDHDVEFEISVDVNDKGMENLTTTSDTDVAISSVEEGATYNIQVVAIDKDNSSLKSEPKSTTVTIDDEDEDVPSVGDLTATYNESSGAIDVSWSYDGPGATYEVSVSPSDNVQTVEGKQLEITNVQPDTTYTITVTPISKEQENKGDSSQVTVTIDPEEEEEEPEESPEEDDEEESEDDPDDDYDEDEPDDESDDENSDEDDD